MIKRQEITIRCFKGDYDGELFDITIPSAYVCGGLAIHKPVDGGKKYVLTHLTSGVALCTGFSLPARILQEALQDIASTMNWQQSYDAITSEWLHNEKLRNSVFKKLEKLHR